VHTRAPVTEYAQVRDGKNDSDILIRVVVYPIRTPLRTGLKLADSGKKNIDTTLAGAPFLRLIFKVGEGHVETADNIRAEDGCYHLLRSHDCCVLFLYSQLMRLTQTLKKRTDTPRRQRMYNLKQVRFEK